MYRRDVFDGPSVSKGKRDNRFKRQHDADRGLKVISQPSHITAAQAQGYDYLVEAGRGVTIFALDGGAEISHRVSLLFPKCRMGSDKYPGVYGWR